jgi:hypothetical protein
MFTGVLEYFVHYLSLCLSPPMSRQANSCDLIPDLTVLVVVILQLVLLDVVLHLQLLHLLEPDTGCGRSSI